MSRASKIKYIVIHTSAGYRSGMAIDQWFKKPKSEGGRGWNTGGYHRIIERNGAIFEAYDFNRITNGVRGYNSESIHICYVGGLNREALSRGEFISEDTRTDDQRISIEECIVEAIAWLKTNGKDVTKDLMILGHRDFSVDGNGNNVIESWERIKDCPCFDAISEYNNLYGATNSIQLLPSNR